MDAIVLSLGRRILLAVSPLLATILNSQSACQASESAHCCWCCPLLIDCETRCAWQRTWNAPYPFSSPLREYFVPRVPAYCDCDGCTVGCDNVVSDYFLPGTIFEERAASRQLAADAECGVEPAKFERLGQLPNDLDFAGGLPTVEPGRNGR